MSKRAAIVGTGSSLPDGVITNADLEKLVDTSDEWITTRTGIKERRKARPDEYLSQFGIEAAKAALESAGIPPGDVELIICATVTPDQLIPATACFIQTGIGSGRIPAFDMQAGCTGFVYALTVAEQFIAAGTYRTVLVIGAELLTKYVNYEDRTTCIIFGDGAGAVVVTAVDPPRGILASALHNDGSMACYIEIPGGATREPISAEVMAKKRHLIHMKGNETFKIAIRSLEDVCREVCEAGGVEPADVDLLIPHQANSRIIDAVGERLKIDPAKCVVNIQRVGNTSSASIPIALDEAVRAGRLKSGDILLMAAFGAGLTWGATLCRW
ncbi:MAG: beta-ketoacyl-ACP synthase III [Acidobacteriota bacterium]